MTDGEEEEADGDTLMPQLEHIDNVIILEEPNDGTQRPRVKSVTICDTRLSPWLGQAIHKSLMHFYHKKTKGKDSLIRS